MTPEQIAPAKATYHVGQYNDGETRLEVSYDTTAKIDAGDIRITMFDDQWVSIDPNSFDALMAALQSARSNVRAILEEASND